MASQKFSDGYLSTSGNQIVDSKGNNVEIAAVNWFGGETPTYAPHGLWQRDMKEMMDQMASEGFNTLRLPFSTEAILENPVVNGVEANPELDGKTTLEVFDAIVDYAGKIGLRIFFDNHRTEAGSGPSDNGLWYNDKYSEADWIKSLKTIAERYKGDDTVIGMDFANEPHNGTWGGGGPTDWAAAAERAANAVHKVNPDLLAIVEGVGTYNGDSYWWGGNLKGVADRPIKLNVDNKLVYSPHDYPNSVFPQDWFTDGSDLYEVFRENWGYIYEEGIAPILVGEMGSRLEDPLDVKWANAITNYLGGDFDGDGKSDISSKDGGMSFAWWSWNPNSGDTGGVLEDDWTTVRAEVRKLLDPLIDDNKSGGKDPVDKPDKPMTPPDKPSGEDKPDGDKKPDSDDKPDGNGPQSKGDIKAYLDVEEDWDTGAIVTLNLTNTGSKPVTDWKVLFDFEPGINGIWNGKLKDLGDGRVSIEDLPYNAQIDPGETIEIGMNVDQGNLDEQDLNRESDFVFV